MRKLLSEKVIAYLREKSQSKTCDTPSSKILFSIYSEIHHAEKSQKYVPVCVETVFGSEMHGLLLSYGQDCHSWSDYKMRVQAFNYLNISE